MKTGAKRLLTVMLAVCMFVVMLPGTLTVVDAVTPGYTVSSAYKSSSYYATLSKVVLTGNQREDIVNVALSQVGYREGSYSGDYVGSDDGSYNNYTEYNYWYHNYVSSGMPVGGSAAPWCATFVSWCAEQSGVPSSILKRSTAAGHGASYFDINFYSGSSTLASSGDNDSYFKGYNYTPKKGDLFYTRSWSHVGLVVSVNGAYVTTVEGNTNTNGSSEGNGVYLRTTRKITDLYFGVPNYVVGTHTCDKGEYVYYQAVHPHYNCYCCSICGEVWANTGSSNYVSSCLTCQEPGKSTITGMQRTYASGSNITFNWTETENTTQYNIWIEVKNDQGEWQRYDQIRDVSSGYQKGLPDGEYRCVIQSYNSNYWQEDGSDWLYTESDYVYFVVGRHDCDKSVYMYYEAVHPHYSCYRCSLCGVISRDFTTTNYISSCLECNRPEKPALMNMKTDYLDSEEIIFAWKATTNTTHNSIYIDCKNAQGEWKRYENAHYVESGCIRTLPLGEYRVLLQSTNSKYYEADGSSWLYKDGDFVYFDVVSLESQYPEKPVLDNMKSTYLDGEEIIFTWAATDNTTHYNFWLYAKNDQDEWEEYEHTFYVTSGLHRQLPVGEYRCLVQSYNSKYWQEDGSDWLYTESDYYYFMVTEPQQIDSVDLRGSITSFGVADDEVTVQLMQENEEVAKVKTTDGTYHLSGVISGEYTLVVFKGNHVTRTYSLTVSNEDVTLDVKIHMIGDIDGNGKINVGDVSKLNGHIKGSSPLTDEYMILCANVNGGKLNMGDVSVLYAHIKGTKKLY